MGFLKSGKDRLSTKLVFSRKTQFLGFLETTEKSERIALRERIKKENKRKIEKLILKANETVLFYQLEDPRVLSHSARIRAHSIHCPG